MARTLLRVAVAAVVVAAVGTSFAPARGAHAPNRATCPEPDASAWFDTRSPFATGPDRVLDLAVGGTAGDLVATNGRGVVRSGDGGCTWTTVLVVPPTSSVVAVAASGPTIVVLRADRPLGAVAGDALVVPHVQRSADRGRTWRSGDRGLPPVASGPHPSTGACGWPSSCHLLVHPGEPDRAYLALGAPGGLQAGMLHVSDDGGASWRLALGPATLPDLTRSRIDGVVRAVAVDPVDADAVWVAGSGLARSRDAGRTWSTASGVPPVSVAALDVRRSDGRDDVLAVGTAFVPARPVQVDTVLRSVAGAPFSRARPDDVGIDGVAFDSVARTGVDSGVAVGPEGLAQWDPVRRRFVAIRTDGRVGLDRVVADVARDCYWFRARDGLSRYCPRPGRPPAASGVADLEDLTPCPPGRGAPAPAVRPAPALVAPDRVELAVGAEGAWPIGLAIPGGPVPLDVFFLVDSSPSMATMIDGLRTAVGRAASALAGAGFDPWVGLAELNSTEVPYRRLVDLGPLDCRLGRALDGIATRGGGDEPHLLALHQALTGAGDPPTGVPAGRGASFRPGAVRLVVLATDEPVDPFVIGPPRPVVVDAARQRRVRVVGLEVVAPLASPDPASAVRRDLAGLARDTGAVAPAGGLDCDGDGDRDVDGGGAVTCTVGGLGATARGTTRPIDAAIAAIGRAFPLRRELTIGAGAAAGVTTRVVGAAGVADAAGGSATGTLVVRCDAPTAGEVVIPISGSVGGGVVATRAVPVRCTAPPAIAAAVGPQAGLGVAPAAPAPAPVPAPAPSPAAQAQAGAQPGAHPSAAPGGAGLALDTTEPEPAPSPVPVGAALAGAAAAAIELVRRRSQERTAPARVDRR